MKLRLNLVYVLITAALTLFFSACREYKTTTKINNDGSGERTVTVKDKTVEPDSIVFPIPAGNGWRVERTKAKDDTTETVYSATKYFENINDLNNEYKNADKIGIHVNLEKKFRWFYTYFDYQEIYSSYFPFKKISLKSYLTPKEYEQYLNNDTSKAFKKRLDKFSEENYFEYFFDELLKITSKSNIMDLTPEILASKKNLIRENISEHGDKTEDLLKYLESVLGTKSIWKLRDGVDGIVKSIMEKMDHYSTANGSYKNEVVMPGIILNTNAKTVEGNKVLWEFDADRFCYEDFTMTVQSRVINVWTYFVSGAVILAIIVLLILPKFRKKS